VISDLRRDLDEIKDLTRCYAACSGKCLPTFRDNFSVQSLGIKKSQRSFFFWKSLPLKMATIGCPETSVRIDHYMLRNNPNSADPNLSTKFNFD